MPCEKYREALTEAVAAAEGSAPALTHELRTHVDACTFCRTFLNDEQQLFAAIDLGVAGKMNTDVPLPLLQRVRALLAEDRPARRAFAPWMILATAGAAAVVLIMFVLRIRQPNSGNPVRREVVASHETAATVANTAPYEGGEIPVNQAKAATIALNRGDRANSRRLRTPVSRPSVVALEVIVPPEERDSLVRYIAAEKRSQLPAAMITLAASSQPSPWPLLTLEIPDLEMKPLPDLGGDTPDSTEEN